ncbi:MAG: hypothetical protein GHCLOJNM_02720 [bacterium]|nr:hypothetical protein [bacterium]
MGSDLSQVAALEDLILLAERNNPGLRAAHHRWRGALEKIPQVTSLEDPELTYMEYLERTMEPQEELSVMQMFPYPGKLELRGRIESAEAEALRKEMEKRRLDLRAEVKDAYYEYYYLEQTIRITAESLDLLKHFESVAAARYGVDKGGSQDVVKAQVELGKVEIDLRDLEDSRAPVGARLNAAMNRPTTSPLPPPTEIDLREAALETDKVLEIAFQANPELQGLDARIRKAVDQVNLAKKDYYPDFSFGLNWMNGNRKEDVPDEYVAMFRINLPVYRKRLAAGVREAESGVREAQSMREEARNELAVELQSELYRLRNAERQVRLLSEVLLPKARQSVEVTETGYSAGESTFLELVDTERELLAFQENYYRAAASYGQALAKIEALVGRSLVETNARPLVGSAPSAAPLSAPEEAPLEESQ